MSEQQVRIIQTPAAIFEVAARLTSAAGKRGSFNRREISQDVAALVFPNLGEFEIRWIAIGIDSETMARVLRAPNLANGKWKREYLSVGGGYWIPYTKATTTQVRMAINRMDTAIRNLDEGRRKLVEDLKTAKKLGLGPNDPMGRAFKQIRRGR